MEPRQRGDARLPSETVRLSLPDISLDLRTEPGLFSHRRIDTGTAILLRFAPMPPTTGELLDLGCGYGPIALALALRAPRARVWAVDADDRALQATEENVRWNGVRNVVVGTPRSLPDGLRFDAVYSNPPMRIGKSALRALLAFWLDRLQPSGVAYVVVKRQAGADSLATALTAAGFSARRLVAKQGFRVFELTR